MGECAICHKIVRSTVRMFEVNRNKQIYVCGDCGRKYEVGHLRLNVPLVSMPKSGEEREFPPPARMGEGEHCKKCMAKHMEAPCKKGKGCIEQNGVV